MYSDAEVLFFTINSASTLYADSKTFLTKIDSVRKARQLESKRLEKARKTEEDRIAKSKEIEDEKALRQVKQKVRALYNSLMAFKDKNDFHYYGFGVGYKYNKWLKDVQDLKNTPEANLLLGHGFGVGDLEMLGLEYMGSKGQETEYSRWSRKTISDGLRKTINKDRESTDADEEINTTTNNRGTEKRIHVDRFSGDTLDLSKDKFIMILADRFEDKNISYGISVWYDMNTCAWSPGILKIFVYTKDMKLLKTTTAKIQKELVESCQQLEELNLYMGNLIYQAAYINAEFTDDRGEIYYQKRKHLGDIQYYTQRHK